MFGFESKFEPKLLNLSLECIGFRELSFERIVPAAKDVFFGCLFDS